MVRCEKLYLDTFVKFQVIKSHIEADKEITDEIAFIKPLKNGKETMSEHSNYKTGQYVCNTIKDKVKYC